MWVGFVVTLLSSSSSSSFFFLSFFLFFFFFSFFFFSLFFSLSLFSPLHPSKQLNPFVHSPAGLPSLPAREPVGAQSMYQSMLPPVAAPPVAAPPYASWAYPSLPPSAESLTTGRYQHHQHYQPHHHEVPYDRPFQASFSRSHRFRLIVFCLMFVLLRGCCLQAFDGQTSARMSRYDGFGSGIDPAAASLSRAADLDVAMQDLLAQQEDERARQDEALRHEMHKVDRLRQVCVLIWSRHFADVHL
jgi:hypothetical protein